MIHNTLLLLTQLNLQHHLLNSLGNLIKAMDILLSFALFLSIVIGLSKFVESWLKQSEKDKIKVKLEEFWIKLDDANIDELFLIPVKLLESIHASIFGKDIFTKKALLRAGIVSTSSLLILLTVVGVLIDEPFSMKSYPWHRSKLKKELISEQEKVLKEYKEKEDESNVRWLERYYQVRSSDIFIVFHSAFFIIFTLLINAAFDALSLFITRMLLREIIISKSIIVGVCVLATSILIAMLFAGITMILSMGAFIPEFAILFAYIKKIFISNPGWSTIGFFIGTLALWKAGFTWTKILAITTILPIIVSCIFIILSIFIYPVRKQLHSVSERLIDNSIEHDKGVLSYLIILIGSFSVVISLIVKILIT